MFIKTIVSGVLGLGFLSNHAFVVVAQYDAHHQQYFFDPSPPIDRTVFDTKALTPVNEKGDSIYKWAFASTINACGRDEKPRKDTALVKLKGNKPAYNPFEFDWMNYYFAKDSESDLDVEDVYYENKGRRGYVLCGQYTNADTGLKNGFVLRVNEDGGIVKAKIYRGVVKFNSIVPNWKGKGYVAVGLAPPDPQNPIILEKAILVSLDQDLDVVCASEFIGTFDNSDHINSEFHKVIQYKIKKQKLYAAVGTTWSNSRDPGTRTSDALVTVVTERCGPRFANQYGGIDSPPHSPRFNEQAFSVSALNNKKGGGLVVVGNVTLLGDSGVIFVEDDVLAFKVKDDGSADWMGYYNIGRSANKKDRATGVVVAKKSVLVGGETITDEFETPMNYGKDAFLLELKKNNGNVKNVDVFGLLPPGSAGNGAVLDNFAADLELTQDNHAVMIGNTRRPDTSPFPYNQPYLVERYKKVKDVCVDKRYKPDREGYLFEGKEVTSWGVSVTSEKIAVGFAGYALDQITPCPKEDPLAPTRFPTVAPTAKPTFRDAPFDVTGPVDIAPAVFPPPVPNRPPIWIGPPPATAGPAILEPTVIGVPVDLSPSVFEPSIFQPVVGPGRPTPVFDDDVPTILEPSIFQPVVGPGRPTPVFDDDDLVKP